MTRRFRPDALLLVVILAGGYLAYSAAPGNPTPSGAVQRVEVASWPSPAASFRGAPENVASDGSGENKTSAAELPRLADGEASLVIETGAPPTTSPSNINGDARSPSKTTTAPLVTQTAALRAISGTAAYYADWKKPQGSFYAAMPGYRWGHPFYVTVWYGSRHLRLLVQDACQCHVGRPDAKIIDMSWASWKWLTRLPLSRGTARVTVVR